MNEQISQQISQREKKVLAGGSESLGKHIIEQLQVVHGDLNELKRQSDRIGGSVGQLTGDMQSLNGVVMSLARSLLFVDRRISAIERRIEAGTLAGGPVDDTSKAER